MPVATISKAARMVAIVASSVATATVSIIGATVAITGGNIWPWVWVMGALYSTELAFLTAISLRHYRSPEEQSKRAFHARRKSAVKV